MNKYVFFVCMVFGLWLTFMIVAKFVKWVLFELGAAIFDMFNGK